MSIEPISAILLWKFLRAYGYTKRVTKDYEIWQKGSHTIEIPTNDNRGWFTIGEIEHHLFKNAALTQDFVMWKAQQ